ncbi:hypothetical protein Tco_0980373 [Tanacetum coccineum]
MLLVSGDFIDDVLRASLGLGINGENGFNVVFILRKAFSLSMASSNRQSVIQILVSLRSKFFYGHESSGNKSLWVHGRRLLLSKDNARSRFLALDPRLVLELSRLFTGAIGRFDEISGKGAIHVD